MKSPKPGPTEHPPMAPSAVLRCQLWLVRRNSAQPVVAYGWIALKSLKSWFQAKTPPRLCVKIATRCCKVRLHHGLFKQQNRLFFHGNFHRFSHVNHGPLWAARSRIEHFEAPGTGNSGSLLRFKTPAPLTRFFFPLMNYPLDRETDHD